MSVQASLPSSVDFETPLKYLPEGIESVMMAVQPNGGSQSFGENVRIEFSLPSRPNLYIDPKSIHLRYKLTLTPSTAADLAVFGCPAYSPFSALTERINSQVISTINQYNAICQRWIVSNLNVADQYGQQASFGYRISANSAGNDVPSSMDGWQVPGVAAATSLSLSCPLILSAIANADHLLPTGLLGQMQIDLQTDIFTNYGSNNAGTVAPTVSNLELCFLAIEMPPGTDDAVRAMGEKIYIKTKAWATNGQPLANSAGQQTLNYTMRYASLECALLGFYKSGSPNKAFDCVDVTNSNGNYNFLVGSRSYPQVPFNTSVNKAGIMQELRRCFGSIGDWRHSPAISQTEFSAEVATGTTVVQPGKFMVPYKFSKVPSSFNPYQEVSLLSGVSTANTGVSVVVNCASTPGAATTGLLAVEYSLVVVIDTATRTFTIIQ